MCWRPSFRARSTTSVGDGRWSRIHHRLTPRFRQRDQVVGHMGPNPAGPSMVPMNDANPDRGINRPTGEMIESKGVADRTVMAEHSARAAGEQVWAQFEVEALPHVDRLFRLAMWFEGNRSEAEDVMQETMLQALQSFHRFQPGTNCRAWLVTILQHVRSNRRRARGRLRLVDDPDDRLAQKTIPFEAPVHTASCRTRTSSARSGGSRLSSRK